MVTKKGQVSKREFERWVKWLRKEGYGGPLDGLKPSFPWVKRLAKELKKDPPTILETRPRDPRTIASNLARYERRKGRRGRVARPEEALKGTDLVSQKRLEAHYQRFCELLEQLYNQLRIPELSNLCLLTLERGTPISYPYAGIAAMIYDKGAIKLAAEDSDPFLWKCLRQHLIAEFPEFDTGLSDWKKGVAIIVRRCHRISKTIAHQLAKMGWDAAEPYLSPDSEQYEPGVYYDILTALMYECVIAKHLPQFQRVSVSHGLLTLVMEGPTGRKDIARGQSALLDQVEQCCLDIAGHDAIKRKVRQVLKLATQLEAKQEPVRQKLRLVLERGTFKGTCQICRDLVG